MCCSLSRRGRGTSAVPLLSSHRKRKEKMPCGYVYPTRHVNLQHSRQKLLPDVRWQGYNNGVVRSFPLCGWPIHPRRSLGASNTRGLPHYSVPLEIHFTPLFHIRQVEIFPCLAAGVPKGSPAARILIDRQKQLMHVWIKERQTPNILFAHKFPHGRPPHRYHHSFQIIPLFARSRREIPHI